MRSLFPIMEFLFLDVLIILYIMKNQRILPYMNVLKTLQKYILKLHHMGGLHI